MPLTLASSIAWAAAIGLVTLLLGVALPVFAESVATVRIPPGAVVFGSASIVPADDWSESERSATSLTLAKNGVRITFTSLPAQGKSAAVRVLDLADEAQATNPGLTVASDSREFNTPTESPGQLIALAGTNLTAIEASVVESTQAVDVQSLGESTQFGEVVGEIQLMLESIRIQVAPDDF